MPDEVKFGTKPEKKEKNVPALLSAHYNSLASVKALSQHLVLSDVHNNGESKLVVGHINDGKSGFKLKVFAQTSLLQSPSLLALPSAVCSFNVPNGVRAIAVSSMNNIFIYKNMKPYFKYTLPDMTLNQLESEAWRQARDEKIDPEMLYNMLRNLSAENPIIPLSQRSKAFLKLTDSAEKFQFVEKHKIQILTRHSCIVAMTVMNKNIDDGKALSVLIVCTEEKEVIILDVEAFTILKRLKIPSVGVFVGTYGLFDVEYFISVLSRDGHCYLLSRDDESAKDVFAMKTHSVGLIQKGRFMYTANTDSTYHAYSLKGNTKFIRNLTSTPVCIELMSIKSKGLSFIAIALEDKTLTIWNEGDLVDTIKTRNVITAMTFGRYSREDATLITIYVDGGLEIHILRRQADFALTSKESSTKSSGNIKMPKMTSSYLEQVKYEQDNCIDIFHRLQCDLSMMKLRSIEELMKIEKKSLSPLSSTVDVTLSVLVLGTGPTFKLRVIVTNTAKQINVTDRYHLFFLYNKNLYRVDQKVTRLPLLVPAQPQTIDTIVSAISTDGLTDSIRVSISKNNSVKPFVSTIMNMPPSATLQF